MTLLETLTQQNEAFATTRFSPDLTMMPSQKTLLIGCVDPRVDPAHVLGFAPGEVAVIRNIGGRVTPAVFQSMALLRVLGETMGVQLGGAGWNLIVLHHTDCGITRLTAAPELLAGYFGVAPAGLGALAIDDPCASLAVDVAALKANPRLPGGFLVTGVLYDVTTGRIETVVHPAPLRP